MMPTYRIKKTFVARKMLDNIRMLEKEIKELNRQNILIVNINKQLYAENQELHEELKRLK